MHVGIANSRDRLLEVSFKVGGGKSVPGIPGAWAKRDPLPNSATDSCEPVNGGAAVHCNVGLSGTSRVFALWRHIWDVNHKKMAWLAMRIEGNLTSKRNANVMKSITVQRRRSKEFSQVRFFSINGLYYFIKLVPLNCTLPKNCELDLHFEAFGICCVIVHDITHGISKIKWDSWYGITLETISQADCDLVKKC